MPHICTICQKPIEPGSAIYGYSRNHWDCEHPRTASLKPADVADGPISFVGRSYRQKGGYRDNAIRFADKDGGVATTAYSYNMSDDERHAMARRITAALNLTRNLTVEQMEAASPLERNPANRPFVLTGYLAGELEGLQVSFPEHPSSIWDAEAWYHIKDGSVCHGRSNDINLNFQIIDLDNVDQNVVTVIGESGWRDLYPSQAASLINDNDW